MFSIEWEILVRIGISAVCGALIGCEREIRNHAAGLRTILLICVGACTATAVGMLLAQDTWGDAVRVDPGRLPSYVIAGVGFLGAGPILRRRGKVDGLTTAATIWVAAAVGIALGVGRLGFGMATTVLVVVTIGLLQPLSRWLSDRRLDRELTVHHRGDDLAIATVVAFLESYDISDPTVRREGDRVVTHFRYRSRDPQSAAMLDGLRQRLGEDGPMESRPTEPTAGGAPDMGQV